MPTHYESIHVTEDAPEEVIRASYRALSLKYHPDTAGNKRGTEQRMQRINDAHSVLSDAEKRAAYDAELRRQRLPPASAQAASAKTQHVRHSVVSPPRPSTRRSSPLRITPPSGLLGMLSDARLVLPVVFLIWFVVYWLIRARE